jgi:hypothetical protein
MRRAYAEIHVPESVFVEVSKARILEDNTSGVMTIVPVTAPVPSAGSTAPVPTPVIVKREDSSDLITPEDAATIARVPVRRIYAWAKGARWASRPSRKCLRVDERGFRRWLAMSGREVR